MTGSIENIPKSAYFIQGDCSDELTIKKLNSKNFDAIFHIAGQSSGEISFENPVYDLHTNVRSTLLLLKYALNTRCEKFIYASTMSVYGPQPDSAINESTNADPISFYAVGKLASEHYLKIYSHLGLNTTALRLFNVYGPGQNMNNMKQGMVSIFIAQAIKNNTIRVKGSPSRFRDFIFIDDVVNAFILANQTKQFGFNIYNIGTGVRTTVGELLRKIKDNFKNTLLVEFVDSTPGDQHGIYSDIKKVIKELNWLPKIELEDGLTLMVQWALDNE